MWYAVANLAKLWHLLAFCDDKVLVMILEVFSFLLQMWEPANGSVRLLLMFVKQ